MTPNPVNETLHSEQETQEFICAVQQKGLTDHESRTMLQCTTKATGKSILMDHLLATLQIVPNRAMSKGEENGGD